MKNETGNKYGRLSVVNVAGKSKFGEYLWNCICECGNPCIVNGKYLRNGDTKSCGCIQKELAAEKCKRNNYSLNNHPKWKGGKKKHKGGYILVRKDSGYVLEHILVMEQMLGRVPPRGSVVHHCNGDKMDNRPYNLRLFSSQSEHRRYHEMMNKGEK
jgi:hypothetical protein